MKEIKEFPDAIIFMEAASRLASLTDKLGNSFNGNVETINMELTAPPQPQEPEKKEWMTVCSICGKNTTVPFKPNPNGNNIKCRDCYMKAKQ